MSENPRNSQPEFIDLKQIITSYLGLDQMLGLEVGPFDRPFFTKQETNVRFVDYRSTQQARDFAAIAPGHSPEWVVEVDYVVSGSGSWDIVPDGSFDWILSSHALEHTPNLVGFLNMMSSKLKSGGLVISVLPDKRRTFDAYRPITTLGRIVDDYLSSTAQPRPQSVFDGVFYGRDLSMQQSQQVYEGLNDTLFDNDNFLRAFQRAKDSMANYSDAHNYVFTSRSFVRMMQHLSVGGLVDLMPVLHRQTLDEQMSFISIMKKSS